MTSIKQKIIVATSGGKDATFALHHLRYDPQFSQYEVVGMMTTFNNENQRSTAHRLRLEVMQAQAKALGLPLYVVMLHQPRGHYYLDYDQKIGEFYRQIKQQGIDHVMYGDIYLDEMKAYRDNLGQKHGITSVYPLWKKALPQLLRDFFSCGYQAIITAVDSTRLSQDYLGQILQPTLLDNLPDEVDPCAENGEYHTFCFAGPLFKQVLSFSLGERSTDGRNCYIDIQIDDIAIPATIS